MKEYSSVIREEGLQFGYERARVTVQLLERKCYSSVIR